MMPALSLTVQRAVHGLGWVRSASDTSGLSTSPWTWALMKRLLAMQEAAAYRYYDDCYPDKGSLPLPTFFAFKTDTPHTPIQQAAINQPHRHELNTKPTILHASPDPG